MVAPVDFSAFSHRRHSGFFFCHRSKTDCVIKLAARFAPLQPARTPSSHHSTPYPLPYQTAYPASHHPLASEFAESSACGSHRDSSETLAPPCGLVARWVSRLPQQPLSRIVPRPDSPRKPLLPKHSRPFLRVSRTFRACHQRHP